MDISQSPNYWQVLMIQPTRPAAKKLIFDIPTQVNLTRVYPLYGHSSPLAHA
jgi:hypothetical protein